LFLGSRFLEYKKSLAQEEEFLKVDAQLTTEDREKHGIPNSDGIEVIKEELKRERAQTLSVVESSRKRRKR
jgi:hypothetical protein